MAINLHKKFSDDLAKIYTANSFVEGRTTDRWSFSGVKSVLIPSITTQPLVDYQRSGTSRYGTPTDLQDTLQELTMTQDKSFTLVIDKGDNSEQQMIKRAGEVMKQQIAEQVTPVIDKYALNAWAAFEGIGTATGSLTKSNAVDSLLSAEVYFDNHLIPINDRYLYMANDSFKLLRLAPELVGCDNLTKEMIIKSGKGYKGDFSSFHIITVPPAYMPEGVAFIATQKNSVILAQKLRDGKIHQDPPGISGHLLEGRYNFDAFVVEALKDGVYVHKTA